MLTTKCINPEILKVLSLCGHGDKILIADGNYPLASKTGAAAKIYLGVTPGLPTVTEVLDALLSVANFEKAEVMVPEEGPEPAIFAEFRERLGGMELSPLGRYEFYDECTEKPLVLAISTGEQRTYANLLLTLAVA